MVMIEIHIGVAPCLQLSIGGVASLVPTRIHDRRDLISWSRAKYLSHTSQ